MKNILLITATLFLCLCEIDGFAQITFQKAYGGSETDDGYAVALTSDGGYIITGTTGSFGAGGKDVFLIKTDANGDTLWTKVYGGTSHDYGYAVKQTTDGGYIIAGTTNSFGAGQSDVYLIKTNASGDTLWTKAYGSASYDEGRSVIQTSTGYIVAGSVKPNGNDDVFVISTDDSGNIIWANSYGGAFPNDNGNSVIASNDSGYIVCGATVSFGSGSFDVFLIKVNTDGTVIWAKALGAADSDYGWSVAATADGGYIIGAETYSFGAGLKDGYVIKTDNEGNALWSKAYGGDNYDNCISVGTTTDGGYIIGGNDRSFVLGGDNVYLIKTDAAGDTMWTKTIGEAGEYCTQAFQTNDGGYIISGIAANLVSEAVYLIKTDVNGSSGCNENPTPTVVTVTNTVTTSATPEVVAITNVNNTSSGVSSGGATVTTFCTNVGIDKINAKNALAVYPNPVADFLEIELPVNEPFTIQIFNTLGQLIYSETHSSNSSRITQINVSRFGGAVFQIIVTSNSGRKSTTFVKQ